MNISAQFYNERHITDAHRLDFVMLIPKVDSVDDSKNKVETPFVVKPVMIHSFFVEKIMSPLRRQDGVTSTLRTLSALKPPKSQFVTDCG